MKRKPRLKQLIRTKCVVNFRIFLNPNIQEFIINGCISTDIEDLGCHESGKSELNCCNNTSRELSTMNRRL